MENNEHCVVGVEVWPVHNVIIVWDVCIEWTWYYRFSRKEKISDQHGIIISEKSTKEAKNHPMENELTKKDSG